MNLDGLTNEEPAFIDRFALAVRPTLRFLDWLNGLEPGQMHQESAVLIQSIYLVPEMDILDLEAITSLLSHYYRRIATTEFSAWWIVEDDWPKIRNLDEFFQYFECVPSETVVDLVTGDEEAFDSFDESEELDWSDED